MWLILGIVGTVYVVGRLSRHSAAHPANVLASGMSSLNSGGADLSSTAELTAQSDGALVAGEGDGPDLQGACCGGSARGGLPIDLGLTAPRLLPAPRSHVLIASSTPTIQSRPVYDRVGARMARELP